MTIPTGGDGACPWNNVDAAMAQPTPNVFLNNTVITATGRMGAPWRYSDPSVR